MANYMAIILVPHHGDPEKAEVMYTIFILFYIMLSGYVATLPIYGPQTSRAYGAIWLACGPLRS